MAFHAWPEITGLQVGRIGLDHQAVSGDIPQEFLHVGAAPFITDPSGNADMAVQVQVSMKLLLVAGKTMHHDVTQPVPAFTENCMEIFVRIPQVQE